MDILSENDNMVVTLGGEKINSFEIELAITTNGSVSHIDTEAFFTLPVGKMHHSELRLETLAVRVGPLGQIDFWSLWKRYQGS